jgi:hypothetical protein
MNLIFLIIISIIGIILWEIKKRRQQGGIHNYGRSTLERYS